jgi:hypothetical protein
MAMQIHGASHKQNRCKTLLSTRWYPLICNQNTADADMLSHHNA